MLSDFAKLLGRCKFLSSTEEAELFRLWRENDDLAAKELIFKSCAPFALKTALQFCMKKNKLHDLEEYESLAVEGLLRAMDKWDASKGYRLTTYAKAWCINFMQRGMIQERIIPIPSYVASGKLREENSAELKAKAAAAMKVGQLSNATIDCADDENPALILKEHPAEIALEKEQTALHINLMMKGIKTLSEREQLILQRRIFEGKTLVEVSLELNVTRERIRQIQGKAYRSLHKFITKHSQ